MLRECLLSLPDSCPGLSWEVIVVDNGSQDGSVAMLRDEFPYARVIENVSNLGYTLPMNQALKEAQGRYLIQLNPDTLVKPGAFTALAAYLDQNPPGWDLHAEGAQSRWNPAKAVPAQRGATVGCDCLFFRVVARCFPRSRLFGRYLMTYLPEDEIAEVEAVSGSCMFIRRALISQIGYLDELFFAYQEDTDFCFRARQAGWQVMYVPLGEIIHYGGHGGTRVEVYRSIRVWHESYFLYYRKHLAKDYFFLFNGLFYLAMVVKLGWNLLTAFLSMEKRAGTKKP